MKEALRGFFFGSDADEGADRRPKRLKGMELESCQRQPRSIN
jgi:hypothetical protein